MPGDEKAIYKFLQIKTARNG